MEENRVIAMNDAPLVPENYIEIHEGIVRLLGTARAASARTINALMTATYWEIGRRIVDSEQAGQQRAEYGEALIRRFSPNPVLIQARKVRSAAKYTRGSFSGMGVTLRLPH